MILHVPSRWSTADGIYILYQLIWYIESLYQPNYFSSSIDILFVYQLINCHSLSTLTIIFLQDKETYLFLPHRWHLHTSSTYNVWVDKLRSFFINSYIVFLYQLYIVLLYNQPKYCFFYQLFRCLSFINPYNSKIQWSYTFLSSDRPDHQVTNLIFLY